MTSTLRRVFAELDMEERAEWRRVVTRAQADLAHARQLGDEVLIEFCTGRLERMRSVGWALDGLSVPSPIAGGDGQ